MSRITVLANRQVFRPYIDLLLIERDQRGEPLAIGTNVTMERVTEENRHTETRPTFSLRLEAAQELMDELWRCGLRPSEGTGSAGAMAAVEKHLAAAERHGQQWHELALRLQGVTEQMHKATLLPADFVAGQVLSR